LNGKDARGSGAQSGSGSKALRAGRGGARKSSFGPYPRPNSTGKMEGGSGETKVKREGKDWVKRNKLGKMREKLKKWA